MGGFGYYFKQKDYEIMPNSNIGLIKNLSVGHMMCSRKMRSNHNCGHKR